MSKLICECGVVVRAESTTGEIRCPACDALLCYGDDAPIYADPEPQSKPAAPKRKKKRREKSADVPGAEPVEIVWSAAWRRWLDPAALLWIPILAPALAFGVGCVALGLVLRGSLGIVGMPALVFGIAITLAPLAFVIGHFSEILREWAQGSDVDPDWPTIDVYVMARQAAQWLASAAVAGGLGWAVNVYVLGYGAGMSPRLYLASLAAVAWGMTLYFLLGLLATQLWDGVLACNPLVVLPALWRMKRGRISFWLEIAIHIAIYALLWKLMFLVWRKALALGILVWLVFWFILLLGAPRLLRRLGETYHQNRKSIGWF